MPKRRLIFQDVFGINSAQEHLKFINGSMEYTKIDLEDGSNAELIDLNRASSTPNTDLKSIKRDTRDLLRLLESSTSPTVGIIDVSHSGWAYRKKLNGEWKKYFCHLDGNQLFFFDHPGQAEKKHAILDVIFVKWMKNDDTMAMPPNLSQTLWSALVIGTGRIIRLGFEDEEASKGWMAAFEQMHQSRYNPGEITDKEDLIREIEPLVAETERLNTIRWQAIVSSLKQSGFFAGSDTESRQKEGYLELLRVKDKGGKSRKKLYAVLFKDYLYVFKLHMPTKLTSPPYAIIALTAITAIDKGIEDNFIIQTVTQTFDFSAKHDVAVVEWINAINKLRPDGNQKAERVKVDTKGYTYAKPLDGRMTLVEVRPDSKSKSHKLKGTRVVIGRSSSAGIALDDPYVSRSHAKIKVSSKNVPFVVDLGSNKGTKLNGTKITKAPLKPGDVIKIGKTNLTFTVKDADRDFSIKPY